MIEENVRKIDWKKNVFTRVLGTIFLVGLIIGGLLSIPESGSPESLGALGAVIFVFLPLTFIGFIYIVASFIIRKKLTILDKVTFVIILIVSLILYFYFFFFWINWWYFNPL